MQERYLGDSHDFLKYALLRHMHRRMGLSLGLNWYLTRPEQVDRVATQDGEKRHHLTRPEWQAVDPPLLAALRTYQAPADRRISRFEADEVLPPDTRFMSEPVAPGAGRVLWHDRAMDRLASAGLVFLDPDNGFEIVSSNLRSAPKYALYREAADYARRGQIVIAIQFARQCDVRARALAVRERMSAESGLAHLPVLRGRVAPNILLLSLAPPPLHTAMCAALEDFVALCPRAELIA